MHNNNVVASYNALRAAVQVGITPHLPRPPASMRSGRPSARKPRYDYFPIDEDHPNRAEDPYSLSKWICEQQADALVRGL